jgi:predicted transglutaminase-like protease
MSKVIKMNKEDIISGTESAYVQDKKPSKKEVNQYLKKFESYKKEYLKKHTLEDMVYENGSALALLYKEVMRLNQLLTSNLRKDEQKN